MLIVFLALAAVFVGFVLFSGVSTDNTNPLAADNAQVSDEARKALSEMNSDTEISRGLLSELKKSDPNVVDVYTSLDNAGTKMVTMVRQRADGSVEETSVPASSLQKWEQEAKEQNPGQTEATDGSTGSAGNMIMGGLMGYMAARMLMSGSNTGAGVSQFANRDAQQKARTSAVSRYRQSFSPALSSLNRSGSGSNFRGQTSRGSFSSSGSRSGGYASGG